MDHSKYINYRSFYTPSKFAEDNLIVSDGMSYMAAKDFYYDRKTFDNNLVLCVLKGTFYVEQYGTKYTLKGGQGILMKLTDHHKYYTDKVDTAHIIFFHFRGKMLTPILNCLYVHGCLPIILQDTSVIDCIYHCFEITSQQSHDFEYDLSSFIYQTVIKITKPYLSKINRCSVKENSWFVDAVYVYVDNHIYEKITLEQLSEELHMSKFYFSKVFKNFFNTSPMQFVLFRKIQLSLKLLSDPKLSLNDIAYTLGFADLCHFSRTFKNQLGISPTSYKKILRTVPPKGTESQI